MKNLENQNESLFEMFIGFHKPLICAANGPAVGAAATSSRLCDAIVASPTTFFFTPFKQLGVSPEGCSTLTFPEFMGKSAASRVLDDGERLGASRALELGFVDIVVDTDRVVSEALKIAKMWVLEQKPKLFAGRTHILRRVNRRESKALAQAFLSRPFLERMHLMARSSGDTTKSIAFWIAMHAMPYLSKL